MGHFLTLSVMFGACKHDVGLVQGKIGANSSSRIVCIFVKSLIN